MKFKKIYVEITNHCNKNCSFCSKDTLPKREMSIDEFNKVIKEVKNYTNYLYLHVKGEPLIHSHFDEIINICELNKMNVNITTNGTFLNKQKEALKNSAVKQINISLQTYEEDINDLLTTIDEIILSNHRVNIVLRFWALKGNLLEEKHINIINQIKEYYHLDKDLINEINNKKNINVKERLYINRATLFIWPKDNTNIIEESFCNGLKTHIGILSNGTVVPCCLDSNGNINLGNIYNESLETILNKNITKNIINSFKSNKCFMDMCKKCSYRLSNQKML